MYLHSNYTQILAYKKGQKHEIFFLPFFYATFQCGRYNILKKKINLFFPHENIKKRVSKVAHNRPQTFFFTVSTGPAAQTSPELIFHIMILNTDTSVFWHTDTYSVFFRLNTDTDTSVFENHTGY